MSRQQRVADQLIIKYGVTTARLKAGARGQRHLIVTPAIEQRLPTTSEVEKWLFWHFVGAAINTRLTYA